MIQNTLYSLLVCEPFELCLSSLQEIERHRVGCSPVIVSVDESESCDVIGTVRLGRGGGDVSGEG